MALFGSLSTVRSQMAQTPAFKAAFDYLEEALRPGSEANKRLLQLKAGDNKTVELTHGVFAMEQAYTPKTLDDPSAKWESHEKYIDIQAVISGAERMDVTETSNLTPIEDGRPEKDYIFYAPYTRASSLRIDAGQVAVFFPSDAHLPSLALDKTPPFTQKTVVKIPVSAA